jgi:hypothetical protein
MTLRVKHIALVAASVLIPILVIVQDSYGGVQIGTLGSVGVIATGFLAVITHLSLLWKASEDEKILAKKILVGLGVIASFVAPVLTSIYTSLPPTTKGFTFVGVIAGLFASLKHVLPTDNSANNLSTDTKPILEVTKKG